MVTDAQVRRLREKRMEGKSLAAAAAHPSGGGDDLRLVPSPICRSFTRRYCRIFTRR